LEPTAPGKSARGDPRRTGRRAACCGGCAPWRAPHDHHAATAPEGPDGSSVSRGTRTIGSPSTPTDTWTRAITNGPQPCTTVLFHRYSRTAPDHLMSVKSCSWD